MDSITMARNSTRTRISWCESDHDTYIAGMLLLEMCRVVPDGVAGFFVSYECLEKYVESWSAQVRTIAHQTFSVIRRLIAGHAGQSAEVQTALHRDPGVHHHRLCQLWMSCDNQLQDARETAIALAKYRAVWPFL